MNDNQKFKSASTRCKKFFRQLCNPKYLPLASRLLMVALVANNVFPDQISDFLNFDPGPYLDLFRACIQIGQERLRKKK